MSYDGTYDQGEHPYGPNGPRMLPQVEANERVRRLTAALEGARADGTQVQTLVGEALRTTTADQMSLADIVTEVERLEAIRSVEVPFGGPPAERLSGLLSQASASSALGALVRPLLDLVVPLAHAAAWLGTNEGAAALSYDRCLALTDLDIAVAGLGELPR
jgi:hypothetical protein